MEAVTLDDPGKTFAFAGRHYVKHLSFTKNVGDLELIADFEAFRLGESELANDSRIGIRVFKMPLDRLTKSFTGAEAELYSEVPVTFWGAKSRHGDRASFDSGDRNCAAVGREG